MVNIFFMHTLLTSDDLIQLAVPNLLHNHEHTMYSNLF